jgi:hypothetical protein
MPRHLPPFLLVALACTLSPTVRGVTPLELPPLSASPTGQHLDGKLIWADLFTTDVPAATAFYATLLGWEPSTLDRDGHSYVVLRHAGEPVAGITARSPRQPAAPAGRWILYVAVRDLPSTLGRVTRSGGTILAPARDFPRRGVQAICGDPEGTPLGLLQSASDDPPDFRAEAGEWLWAELFARDPARAAAFYREALGYAVSPEVPAGPGPRLLLESGGYARAGIAPLPAGRSSAANWLGVIRVARVDTTAARAAALGGRVLAAPHATPHEGRFALLADPAGTPFGVVELPTPATLP